MECATVCGSVSHVGLTNTITTTTATTSTAVMVTNTATCSLSSGLSISMDNINDDNLRNNDAMQCESSEISSFSDIDIVPVHEFSDVPNIKENDNPISKRQRKRRNRMRKWKDHRSEGVSGVAGSTLAGPSTLGDSLQVPEGVDGKRYRVSGDTPPDIQREQKRLKTYASVVQSVDYIRLGVADKSTSEGITEGKRGLLTALIHNEVVNSVEAGTFIPILKGNFMLANIIVFNCGNQETKTWLSSLINRLNVNWEGSLLEVIEDPTFIKLKMWLPGPIEEPKRIFNLLGKFNTGLNTDGWKSTGQMKYENKGQLIFVLVDPLSLTFLEKNEFKLQYVLNTVSLRIAGDKPASS